MLPGSLVALPIVQPDLASLDEEARSQHLCVFDRLDEVAAGKAAIYRVLRPERATVMLSPIEDGVWVISEFRAVRNRPVKRDTLWSVGAYLSRRQETGCSSRLNTVTAP